MLLPGFHLKLFWKTVAPVSRMWGKDDLAHSYGGTIWQEFARNVRSVIPVNSQPLQSSVFGQKSIPVIPGLSQ